MLAIKLKLIGKKGQHSFRIVVQEKRAKLQGKAVEDLGWFNPHTNQFKIDHNRLKHWLNNGAQPTESIQKVLKNSADTSEVQSYQGRTRPKRKKKERTVEKAPTPTAEKKVEQPAEGQAGEQQSQEAAPKVSPQEETKMGESTEQEKPTEGVATPDGED
jgi:small subunit ribosomal protein S16